MGSFAILGLPHANVFSSAKLATSIQQITTGPENHLFAYIGQSLTIPWNSKENRILSLSSPFIDHLPNEKEPAGVCLIHTSKKEGKFLKVEKVDESLGWNPQQGTMFYWNPENPENQFFFNDRDKKTGKVFTVLYDIEKKKRVMEYRYEDTPVGNGGVCPVGGSYLAINYARMARLRAVTGYKGASDWTEGIVAPDADGIFKIDIKSGQKQLLISFAKMQKELNKKRIDKGEYSGNVRIDSAPRWNRKNNQVLVQGIANEAPNNFLSFL